MAVRLAHWFSAETSILLSAQRTPRHLATHALARRWALFARDGGDWSVAAIAARWAQASALPAERLLDLAKHLVEACTHHTGLDELASCLRRHQNFAKLAAGSVSTVRAAPLPLWQPPCAPAPRSPGAPAVADLGELARLLRCESGELLWLSGTYAHGGRAIDQHYRLRLVARRSSTAPRLLEIPKERLKRLQRRLLDQILAPLPVSPSAHGFVPTRSALTHARLHVGARAILRLDLRDWFLSIGLARVRAQFLRMGYAEPLSTLLARLCTTTCRLPATVPMPAAQRALAQQRHLPQGAPTSPALANRVATRLDVRLAAYAASRGWCYSRYADDLTFSSREQPTAVLRDAVTYLEAIIRDEGFQLNPAKTRLHGAHRQQQVTGIVVNERPNIARAEYDRLRAELHAWTLGRERLEPGVDRTIALATLRGRMAWVIQVNPRRFERLLGYWQRIPGASGRCSGQPADPGRSTSPHNP